MAAPDQASAQATESVRGRILVASMGGTIANQLDTRGHRTPQLSAGDIVSMLPDLARLPALVAKDVTTISSSAITPGHMHHLAGVIRSGVEDGCRGVVVTHGTDTIEETAYALALLVPRDIPIVLTGAMRPPDQPGADGLANFSAALIAAADARLGGYGPVVVFQDEIHLARLVTKAHTSAVAPFRSPGIGPVGWISEARVSLAVGAPAEEYLGYPGAIDKRVELIEVVSGSDGLFVEAAAAVSDGIVLAGTGGGHTPPTMVDSIQRAVDSGVAVILASRTGSGRVLERTYSGPGSESDLLERGLVSAGTLQPIKARLRLLVGLSLGLAPTSLFPS